MADLKKIITFEFDGSDNGAGYEDWAFKMENLLAEKELSAVIVVRVKKSGDSEAPDQYSLTGIDTEDNAKVYRQLALSCKGDALQIVRKVPDMNGRRVWFKLRAKYASTSATRVLALNKKLYQRTWDVATDTLATFRRDIEALFTTLQATGSPHAASEAVVHSFVLGQLPQFFGPVVARALEDESTDLDELFTALEDFEASTSGYQRPQESAFAVAPLLE